jgi:hypothetical protein
VTHLWAVLRAHFDPHIGGLRRPAGFSDRRRRRAQPGDQRQDFGEQPAGYRDFSKLEGDVSAVIDDLCADFDQLFAQAG